MRPGTCIVCFSLSLLLPGYGLAQAADGFWTRQGPDADRAALNIPNDLLSRIKGKIGHAGQPLGYSYEQMLGFPPFEHRLRTLENLFRDVMHPAEFGGLMGDNLIAKESEPAQISYLLWSQLEARASREWAVPKTVDDWGVDWIKKGTPPMEALRIALDRPNTRTDVGFGGRFSDAESQALDRIGNDAVRLVARLVIAAHLADPYLKAAGRVQVLSDALTSNSGRAPSRQQMYDLLVQPYLGDVNDDTIIVPYRESYQYMRDWDRNYAAFGANLYLRHFDAALSEYRASTGTRRPNTPQKPLTINCPLGPIVIGTDGPDAYTGSAALIIDFGGDDRYSGLIATPADAARPVSVVVDFGGNDIFDGTGADGNVGCGLFGLGMLFDASGNDSYKVKNGGIGFGLYGTGIVIDDSGNDIYDVGKGWGQGAAYAGVGLVIDRAGNDRYRSICMSMGFGGTLGVGTLLDLKGSDDYLTADTGNESKVWGKTVSMSMGCGYGRRCDSGDGQNQGGGFGILVDAEGDDKYHTSIFSLGSGYWWGAGIFEDRAGDDTYRCTHYCMGSGAHFALGSFVDLKGNDRYNDRPDAVERWAAIARDGSLAVCIDGGGDDVWGNLTGGHADLNSYALFWEKSGDDVYKRMQPFDPAMIGNRPFGSAVPYAAFRNFRDRLMSAGIFLDTGGKDVYPAGMTAAEDTEWMLYKGPLFWSFGQDLELAAK